MGLLPSEYPIARTNEIKDKDDQMVKTTESQTTPVAADESESDTPSAGRLVIRIKIPKNLPGIPVRRRPGRGALLLILGAVAVLLSWVGISVFRTDPTPAPAISEVAPTAESQAPTPAPAPSEVTPVASDAPPEVPEQPDAPPSPINEVIPDVPRSALETIRGTVRVTVRVIVAKDGTVAAATADDPGPSRYFERLAIEASRKWTFTPADSQAQRIMLVRFYFRRTGTTARAESLR
jgi:TonB family protein